MADHCSHLACAICCGNSIGSLSCHFHVLIPAGKSVERVFKNRERKYFLPESTCDVAVCYFNHSHHRHNGCV